MDAQLYDLVESYVKELIQYCFRCKHVTESNSIINLKWLDWINVAINWYWKIYLKQHSIGAPPHIRVDRSIVQMLGVNMDRDANEQFEP